MYGSIICRPLNKNLIYDIEKIQHEFLRFLSYKTNYRMHPFDHNYDNMLNLINFSTLESARTHADLIFLYKLERDKIGS